MMNQPTLEFSPEMRAILAAARRPSKAALRAHVIGGVVVGASYTDWSRLTLLVQTTPDGREDERADFTVRGYRVIGPDAHEDACSVSVSMPAGSEAKVARLSFPDAPVQPGKECYYAAFLDFARSAGDDGGEIANAIFLVVDDQLTCHVLGGSAAAP
jgi:hypothetical protein